jgi:predicted N-acetyltransferase YhbS
MTRARRATKADIDAVVGTLVDSHLDYVWEVWALQRPDRRDALIELVRHHIELIALPHREVWMSDDGAAVACWQSASADPVSDAATTRMAEIARSVYGARLELIEQVDVVLHAHRPVEPHHFLGSMGVRPDRQRQGLGSAVLAPVLERLDRTGVPACLETSAAGNVKFYESLGFAVRAFLEDLPADAPATWVMWRQPRAGASSRP